jgi:hypothetical protein
MALLDQKEGPADVSRKRVQGETAAIQKNEDMPKRKAVKRKIVESSSEDEELSLEDESDDHSQWDDDEEI